MNDYIGGDSLEYLRRLYKPLELEWAGDGVWKKTLQFIFRPHSIVTTGLPSDAFIHMWAAGPTNDLLGGPVSLAFFAELDRRPHARRPEFSVIAPGQVLRVTIRDRLGNPIPSDGATVTVVGLTIL